MSLLQSFARMVPPPTFMQLPSVGVDVSDTSLKYMQFVPHYGRTVTYSITGWGDIDIPIGALDRGHVNDVKQLSQALAQVRERTGATFVRVSLPEERAYIFETEVRIGTPLSEIRSQLEFRLEEHVPISPREAFFDFQITTEVNNSLSVSVVVYARETIMNYYEACQLAGVTPIGFEVEAQAIVRATLPPDDDKTHMIIDFGKTRTGVGIVHAGHLLYTSTIDIGGSELSKAMRRILGNDVAESELTRIKNTEGLVTRRGNTQVYEILLAVVSGIKDEIATRLQYWHTREHDLETRRIQSIILCGGSANLKGVTEYFTETLGIPTVRGDVWRNVPFHQHAVPPMEKRFSYGYATTIGLALKHTV